MPPDSRAGYEAYGRRAADEGWTLHCSEPTVTNAVIEMARAHLTDAATILDLGCGANLDYDIFLSDLGKRPVCVDFTMSFLRLAPKDPRMRLVQADATVLPFAPSTFDGVICSETIEHIERDDAVIGEIARVLRPGGVLVMTVPNLWNAARLLEMIKQRDLTIRMMTGHLREYTPGHLRNLLRPHFTIEEWTPVTFGWTGKFGGMIDRMVRVGVLKRFSKSIAFVARLNRPPNLRN
jgi:ubiquinone/menaquinone biosynthesis C-methylase UbiE